MRAAAAACRRSCRPSWHPVLDGTEGGRQGCVEVGLLVGQVVDEDVVRSGRDRGLDRRPGSRLEPGQVRLVAAQDGHHGVVDGRLHERDRDDGVRRRLLGRADRRVEGDVVPGDDRRGAGVGGGDLRWGGDWAAAPAPKGERGGQDGGHGATDELGPCFHGDLLSLPPGPGGVAERRGRSTLYARRFRCAMAGSTVPSGMGNEATSVERVARRVAWVPGRDRWPMARRARPYHILRAGGRTWIGETFWRSLSSARS